VLKQLQTKTVAIRNERTNFYIRYFYLKAMFALLSVIVGGWEPSVTSIEGNIYNKLEVSGILCDFVSRLFTRK
jgi:hypothetical protein